MILTRVQIAGFGTLRSTDLRFKRGINLVIGPNEAGKSTLQEAVLSALFGIQARSGCFCAGPYIHRLYPIGEEWSERMAAEAGRGHLGAKLAFTRLSFSYAISDTAFEYVLAAVHLLAREGHRLRRQ